MGRISQINSRNLDRGKSFRFSTYNQLALYKNDEYVQDFVLYNGAVWACASNTETNSIPERNNKDWIFVISGIEGKSPKFVFVNNKLYYYYETETKKELSTAEILDRIMNPCKYDENDDQEIQLLGGFDIKGEKGDALRFEDLTDAQKAELKGESGKDGLNGANGRDGQNGRDGINGRDGLPGKDGKDGQNGSTYIPSVSNSTVTWTLTQNTNLPNNIQMPLLKGEDAYDYYRRLELEKGNTPLSKQEWLRSQFTEIQKIWIDNIDENGVESDCYFLHVLTNSCCYSNLISPIDVTCNCDSDYKDIIYEGDNIHALLKETGLESPSHRQLCALVGKVYKNHRTSGEIFNDYENNQAKEDYSHAEGLNTIASRQAQHVEGKYNYENAKAISIIGIGNSTTRKNAMLVLDNTGDVYILGIGNYAGQETGSGIKSLQNVINDFDESITEMSVDIEYLKDDIQTIQNTIQTEIDNRQSEDIRITDLIEFTKQELISQINNIINISSSQFEWNVWNF